MRAIIWILGFLFLELLYKHFLGSFCISEYKAMLGIGLAYAIVLDMIKSK